MGMKVATKLLIARYETNEQPFDLACAMPYNDDGIAVWAQQRRHQGLLCMSIMHLPTQCSTK